MVVTRVNLKFFYFKKCTATWQVTIMPRVKLTLVVFNLAPLFTILIQFSPQFFKMIQFCPLQFESKLIIKLITIYIFMLK